MSERLGFALAKEFAAIPEATRRFVLYLGIQAAVLVLAWPSEPVHQLLYQERAPWTLFAFAVALGATTAYLQLRAGAEELMNGESRSLSEWAVVTPVSLPALLSSYLGGHLVQSAWILVLSSPLLVIALVPSGSNLAALSWLGISVLVHALFFRLVGACLYAIFGQLGLVHFALVRLTGLTIYTVFFLKFDSLSHAELSRALTGHSMEGGAVLSDSMALPLGFTGAYLLMSLGLLPSLKGWNFKKKEMGCK